MKILILYFILFSSSACVSNSEKQTEQNRSIKESFDLFYKRFYSDKDFQKERIQLPLEGGIKAWSESNDTTIIFEQWTSQSLVGGVSNKDSLIKYYPNVRWNIEKKDTVVFEKYWLENSGFFINRNFRLVHNKWYLYLYEISNL